MKALRHVPWALLVLASLTWVAMAAHVHQGKAAPAQPPVEVAKVCEGGYSIAPPAGGNGVLDSSLEPLTFCPCLIGFNCCGDSQCPAGSCGKACQCHCNGSDQCVH